MGVKIEHLHRYRKVTIDRTFVYQASNLVIRRAQRNIGSALQVTPGGNQVDGLPPRASTDWSPVDAPATTDLFIK